MPDRLNDIAHDSACRSAACLFVAAMVGLPSLTPLAFATAIAVFILAGPNVTDMVPLATLRKTKGQLREERRLRAQAEAERDQLKATLGRVLDGVRNGEERK